MKRIAAIYDIHGNLPALEAVLAGIRDIGVDAIVMGGDIVPGPMSRESLDLLLGLDIPVHSIRGNGEAEVLAHRAGVTTGRVPAAFLDVIRWSADQLSPEHETVLAGWPATLRLDIDGPGEVLFCHATPASDVAIFTRLTPESALLPAFADAGASTVICGHTHMQFDRRIGDVRVVNAGSVGMPYGEPGAYWLLLGSDVELRRTPYDLDAAAERIGNTTYPQADSFVANDLRQPRSEAVMLELFGRVDLAARP